MSYQVQIRIKGQIDERWSEWLGGLTITHTGENETLLAGPIEDQAALYGLISKLRNLSLALVAVEVGELSSTGETGDSPQTVDRCTAVPR